MKQTPKQLERMKQVAKIIKGGNLSVVESLFDLEDKVEEQIAEIKKEAEDNALPPEIVAKIKQVKGEKGDIGPAGKDGKDGKDGRDGKEGPRGFNGDNGLPGKNGVDGKDGKNGFDGTDGQDGTDGKDGSPDTPIEIAAKVNTLVEKIDPKSIRGYSQLESMVKRNTDAASLPATTTHFSKNGQFIGRAKNINLVEGTNTTLAMTVNGDTANVTLTSSGGAGSGTVTSVTSADANATVATTTTTPVITIVSAPKLQTARTIAGVSFDGSANISIASTNLSNTANIALDTNTLTLTNKTLTSPVINTPTGIVKGDVGLGNVDNTSDATKNSATATLTNKRVTKRVVVTTQSATPTINTDNTDVASITALAQAITSMTTNLSGTPVAGDLLMIQITDNATARAITWGASFQATTIALPTTTVISTMLRVGFQWNTVASKWDCIAVA